MRGDFRFFQFLQTFLRPVLYAEFWSRRMQLGQ
jgi:hypothetical protein